MRVHTYKVECTALKPFRPNIYLHHSPYATFWQCIRHHLRLHYRRNSFARVYFRVRVIAVVAEGAVNGVIGKISVVVHVLTIIASGGAGINEFIVVVTVGSAPAGFRVAVTVTVKINATRGKRKRRDNQQEEKDEKEREFFPDSRSKYRGNDKKRNGLMQGKIASASGPAITPPQPSPHQGRGRKTRHCFIRFA